MHLPNFLILGAAKCGTTSLHDWLACHPEILMSEPKEPFFFEAEYEAGLEAYWQRYFAERWSGQRLIGESRHRNLYLPYIPARIKASAPGAKFIVILREPAVRAMSHWWHWFRTGREPLYFEDALRADLERIESGRHIATPEEIADYAARLDKKGQGPHRTYLDSGHYAEQLERYWKLFDREQFLVIIFEEMTADPAGTVRRVCRFLGADPEKAAGIDFTPANISPPMRFRPAFRWALRSTAARLGRRQPPSPRRPILVWQKPTMAQSTQVWLREHYASHNRRLEALLGTSLRAWNDGGGRIMANAPGILPRKQPLA